jgi:large subunit ribosomal protein L10
MGKPMKARMMQELATEFGGVDGAVAVRYRGLTAERMRVFRQDLRKGNLRVLVVRNALARQALATTPLRGLDALFEGPTALVYGTQVGMGTAIAAARAVLEWNKNAADEEKLVPTGAVNEGELMRGGDVDALSKLPDRDTLRGMVAVAVHGAASGLARCVNGVAGGMARCLQQRIEKLEKEGAPAAGTPA